MNQNSIPIYMISRYPQTHLLLSLGIIEAYVHQYKNGVLDEKFHFMPFLNKPTDEIIEMSKISNPGVWLFSDYIWSIERGIEISKAVKEINPQNVTIHGGPSVPKREAACREFLLKHPYIDIAARGEGEATTAELLEHIAFYWDNNPILNEELKKVFGISFGLVGEQGKEIVRTPERKKFTNINEIPSPYLTGVFEKSHEFPKEQYLFSMIETNRGCPFECAYCNWGDATNEKVRKFALDRVKAEIEWLIKNRFHIIYIVDANFGIFKRDLEIMDFVVAMKKKYDFPKEIVLCFAKHSPKRLFEISQKLNDSGITFQCSLSIQTRDDTTLNISGRQNIDKKNYDKLLTYYQKANLPVTTEIMLGLPGATIESLKTDLQYYFDRNTEVRTNYTLLLVNSPMADPAFMKKYQIEINAGKRIISTFSYSSHDREQMIQFDRLHRILVNYSFFKYGLKYLQLKYNIPAMDFLHEMIKYKNRNQMPEYKLINSILTTRRPNLVLFLKVMAGHLKELHAELKQFACQNYPQILDEAEFDMVLEVNQAIIPNPKKQYPLQVDLKHNFAQYYWDAIRNNMIPRKRLSDYPGNRIKILDPYHISKKLFRAKDVKQYSCFQTFFELESPLKQSQSNPYWFNENSQY